LASLNGSVESRRTIIARDLIIVTACVLFVLVGSALIPRAGLDLDEVLFAAPLYLPVNPDFNIIVLHRHVPLMAISYIGTLKTLLYWPILRIFGPNIFAVRFPMLVVGALTVFLFYRLTNSTAGGVAATIASLLLVTDPTFLMSDAFDWGPVALQLLLLVAGCLMIAGRRYGFGFLFFGLALWNKALFLWVLAGLGAGAVAVYPGVVLSVLRDRKTMGRIACGFLAGALPFLIYNIHRPNATLGSNAGFSSEHLNFKVVELGRTLDGSGFMGFIPAEDSAPGPKMPSSRAGRLAFLIRQYAGEHRTSIFPYGIIIALLVAPLWWRSPGRRAALFAIVFSIVTFAAMLITRGGGMGVHHFVFLWPMPHLLVGIAIAALRPRWLGWACGTILVASNLLVINQYFFQFERDGATWRFTDALNALNESLSSDDHLYIIDWNIFDNLYFLRQGKADFRLATDLFIPANPSAADELRIAAAFSDPRAIFVSHVSSLEAFQGVGEHLEAAARKTGYHKTMVQVISDSHERPMFEVFRVRSLSPVVSGR
jgi:hypothetical protein